MIIKINKKLGNHTIQFDIEEKDDIEAFHKMAFLTAPDYCGACKGNNIVWNGRKATSKKDGKTYTFVSRKCLTCGAESQLGQHQTGGYYWKGWEVYQKDAQNAEKQEEAVVDIDAL